MIAFPKKKKEKKKWKSIQIIPWGSARYEIRVCSQWRLLGLEKIDSSVTEQCIYSRPFLPLAFLNLFFFKTHACGNQDLTHTEYVTRAPIRFGGEKKPVTVVGGVVGKWSEDLDGFGPNTVGSLSDTRPRVPLMRLNPLPLYRPP